MDTPKTGKCRRRLPFFNVMFRLNCQSSGQAVIATDKFPAGSPFYHLSPSVDTRDFPDIGEFAPQTALFMLNIFHVRAELTRGGKSSMSALSGAMCHFLSRFDEEGFDLLQFSLKKTWFVGRQ
jgi:hypothetical protein